jgi:hypothetical protein
MLALRVVACNGGQHTLLFAAAYNLYSVQQERRYPLVYEFCCTFVCAARWLLLAVWRVGTVFVLACNTLAAGRVFAG